MISLEVLSTDEMRWNAVTMHDRKSLKIILVVGISPIPWHKLAVFGRIIKLL